MNNHFWAIVLADFTFSNKMRERYNLLGLGLVLG